MKKIFVIIALLTLILAACQPIITEEKTLNQSNVSIEETQNDSQDNPLVVEQQGNMSIVDDHNEVSDEVSDEVSKEDSQSSSKDDYLGLTGEVFVVESTEGNLVKLNPKAEDPDGDAVYYYFSEPFNSKGEWQTSIGDEGKYKVTITASDGKINVSEDILVVIHRANRAPEINCESPITVKEGEVVNLDCDITDVDQDGLIIGYSGWMTSSTYQTTFEDAGNYEVTVTASDATHKTTKTIEINVLNVNRAPIVNDDFPTSITVKEGQPIKIDTSKIVDPDGDKLSISFTEPFNNEGEWTPQEGQAGIYYVEATISDGQSTINKQINVDVLVKNRPPVFVNLN